jgi:polyisoprenoid-binding protein YceI
MSTTAVEIPGYVAGTYTIDPGHSDVAFTVRHLMVSKVRGHFTRFQGELTLAPDPLASTVTASIEPASIDTNNPQRDDDLRSANFFEIDAYPTMTFRSTGIRHGEDGFDVDGELTLHGVTRPVTLALDVNGFTRDPYGGTRAGFSATTELDRGDFRISTNIHGRRRGGHRRPHPGLHRDRSRPQPTPAGQPLALTVDLQEDASRFPDWTRADSLPARKGLPGRGGPTARQ